MYTKRFKNMAVGVVACLSLSSCFADLDTLPLDKDEVTAEEIYKNPDSYKQVLAKCYAGLAVSGQQGPSDNPDISGYDEGAAQYMRAYFNLQELPTDEAVVGWNDPGLPELNTMTWTSGNSFVYVMYSRIYLQIAYVNEYLRQTTEAKLNERGITGDVRNEIPTYRDEARFLRALSYWHGMDLFGNIPFVTEDDGVGAFLPPQKSRAEIFAYIESELKSIESNGYLPTNGEYPRAGMTAVQTLMARLYLNSEAHIGTPRWADTKTYAEKVIQAKSSGETGGLALQYKYLFAAENDKYARGGSQGEIIFAIAYDKDRTRTYGGTKFFTSGAYGGDMSAKSFGMIGSWGGIRTTPQIVDLFDRQVDRRAAFFDSGNKENTALSIFGDGWGCYKYTNLLESDWDNTAGREEDWPDTDFPVFRLSDAYLMYAEAAMRLGEVSDTQALSYFNLVRARAGLSALSALTEEEMLNERGREFYWESQRRTDLIRFGKFTGGQYNWSWKGGVLAGKSTDSKYRIFPIPAKDIAANPNLKQNPGY
ncbi:MAG: RagB/SusD family nutrient uptake outer membrane protein [Bacteroidales bacterium]